MLEPIQKKSLTVGRLLFFRNFVDILTLTLTPCLIYPSAYFTSSLRKPVGCSLTIISSALIYPALWLSTVNEGLSQAHQLDRSSLSGDSYPSLPYQIN